MSYPKWVGIPSATQIMCGTLYSSVGRAGDCNVNVDIPRSLVRIQLERYLRLCGRVVYGASLRHWSLRRRGFKSRLSQRVRIPLSTDLIWRSSCSLLVKALVSEARDCGFKSRRGLPLDYKEKLTHMGLQTDTLAVRVRIPIIPLTLPPPRIPGELPLMTTPVHDDIM